jgi:hypothetical protein
VKHLNTPSSGSSNYSRDDDDSDNINKKQKLEEWMKDSQQYNVPFVGTAIAKGDVGTVIANQWPCGLLQAYLIKSPMAVEFTSDQLLPPNGHVHKRLLRNKQGKMSHAIYKAYLEALQELITAAVPTTIVAPGKNHHQQQQPYYNDKFIGTIVKDRLPTFLSLLHEETGYGKGKSDSTALIGPLAAPVLNVFHQLASTSVGVAREMTRTLDASLRDGVLRLLLRPPKAIAKATAKESTTTTTTKTPRPTTTKTITRLLYKTRAACLNLGAVLVEWNDPTTTSYVATSGSRERKIQPGLLYLALRLGLTDADAFHDGTHDDDKDDDQDHDHDDPPPNEEYVKSVARLLEAVRGLLPTVTPKGSRHKEDTLSRRALTELLAADALQHISRIATCAANLVDYGKGMLQNDFHSSCYRVDHVDFARSFCSV